MTHEEEYKEFEFYDKKIEEFDSLLSQAKSQTLIGLFKSAKQKTEQSLELLVLIQKATVVYLTEHNIKTKDRTKKFKNIWTYVLKKLMNLKLWNLLMTLETV